MNILSALFNKKSDGRGSRRVKIIDSTICEPLGETRRHVNAGEEITVSQTEYEHLCAGGKATSLEFIPSASAQARPKSQPVEYVRPKIERSEPPPELKDMPKAFAEAWQLEHELECRRRELAIARRQCTQAGHLVVGPEAIEREEGVHRLQKFVIDAEEKVRTFDFRGMYLRRIEAGDLLLAEVDELNEMIAEARETAFQAFSERLAPLGLHREKAASLFAGSALYQKFACTSPLSAGRRCFKGDDDDLHATYSDEGLPQILTHYRTARTRRPSIEKLLKDAKAELATARKAMKSAAA